MKRILIKFGGSLFVDEHSREQFWLDIKTLIQKKIVFVQILHTLLMYCTKYEYNCSQFSDT